MPPDSRPARASPFRVSALPVAFALAALVFATRAWLVNTWASPLPFWDQWDVEPPLYKASLSGTLRWTDLFAAHNEHRIALTRIADLALFEASGGWNVWAQMILNAVLHAASAAVLLAMFWSHLPARGRAALAIGMAILFTAITGWNNALWGFQSQVYFANVLDAAAVALLLGSRPLAATWWCGGAAALLALFSNAGGVLVVPAILIADFCGPTAPPAARRHLARLSLLALIVVSFLLRTAAPGHEAFHARTAAQFFGTLARTLSWPHIASVWPWLVLQLPLVGLCFVRWRHGKPLEVAERRALALGLFGLFQAVAIAYARGGTVEGFRPLSRHQDPLLLGVAGQLFAATRLALEAGRAGRGLFLTWSGAVAAGLLSLTSSALALHLPLKRMSDRANLAAFQHQLASPDTFVAAELSGLHPNPAIVQSVLADPRLGATLPSVREGAPGANARPWIVRHGSSLVIPTAVIFLAMLVLASRAPTAAARGDIRAAAP